MKDSFVILQGINLVDTITFINRKNKKFQATLLSQIEEVIDPESEKYLYIRKLVLDSFNNYTFVASVVESATSVTPVEATG